MPKTLALTIAILSMFLAQCGITPKAKDTHVYEKVNLTFFAGGSCEPCKKELPLVRDRLAELGVDRDRVQVQVYLTLGKFFGPVQPGDTQKFQQDHGLPAEFEMLEDNKCPDNGVYKKYYPNDRCAIPRTVIRTPDGEQIAIFKPKNKAEEMVDDIMVKLKDVLKGEK